MIRRDKILLGVGTLAVFCFGLFKNKKPKLGPVDTLQRDLYFTNALQYHAAARFAAFSGFIPVCGNLFHHAIEFYLKGYLANSTDESDRRKMGHNLKRMWRRFKADVANANLDRFDSVIAAVDKHEKIRYPEYIREHGMGATVTFAPQLVARKADLRPQSTEFEIVVDDLDALASEILARANINSAALTAGYNAVAREFLNRENKSRLIAVQIS
jgi:HEPN domain-containing protein